MIWTLIDFGKFKAKAFFRARARVRVRVRVRGGLRDRRHFPSRTHPQWFI